MGPNQTDKLLYSKRNHKINKIRLPAEWEKIVSNDASDKDLISKIFKQLIQLISKTNKQPN